VVNWKEQFRELKDLSKQDNRIGKWTSQPTGSLAKISSRVERVILTFIQNTGWSITTDAWGYKRATVFKVHPKSNNDKPWEYLENQIVVNIDSDYSRIEIEPPSALSKRNSLTTIPIPLSDFNEEKLASHLKEIYIQLTRGAVDELTKNQKVLSDSDGTTVIIKMSSRWPKWLKRIG